jgi:hypothetical protein
VGDITSDPTLSQQEWAAEGGPSVPTQERWRQKGLGPAYTRLGPRRIVYRLSAIRAWLEQNTFRHRAEELARGAGESARDAEELANMRSEEIARSTVDRGQEVARGAFECKDRR